MSDPDREPAGLGAANRWIVYTVLIAAALGQATGKILAVNSVDVVRLERNRLDEAVRRERARLEAEGFQGQRLDDALAAKRQALSEKLRLQRPFLSANDRSRWMAIRAIAENGNHEIESFLEEPTWDTIDMVQHVGRDGDSHQYSSKPPLLMVLLAGPYWVLMQATGLTLGDAPYVLGRTLLLLYNGGALALLLTATARIIERIGRGDVDRLFAMATAAFGTQLSAFAPVLSNHLFSAAATAVAIDLWMRLQSDHESKPEVSFWCGLAASLAAAFELPALALTAAIGLSLALRRPGETVNRYGAAVLLVGFAFFATNYWAHNSLRPPYAHRSTTDPADNWYDYEYTARGKSRASYWRNRQGIDVGEPSRATYAVHSLIGHHGVLSLTPVWLLSLGGGALLLGSRGATDRQLAWGTLAITAACLVFYIGLRPQDDRNYGGSTSGFRWLFWLAPMWVAMLPAAIERLRASRLCIGLAATLLALSAMSASYPTWNPWTHPWLYRWMEHLGFNLP